MNRDRLIVALDYHNFTDVEKLENLLGDAVSYYKVGMELYYSCGEKVISFLRDQGKNVFLDLKLHDIPNTVAKSAAALTRLGVTMLNVHASGGPTMMTAALQAVEEEAYRLDIVRPRLIAVTVLTSMSQVEWEGMGMTTDIKEQVLHLAAQTQIVGLDGVVASSQEAVCLRECCGKDFLIVTPGIRPAAAALNDQTRVATPAGALQAGASHLVVGRPITQAADPKQAALAILAEMKGVTVA